MTLFALFAVLVVIGARSPRNPFNNTYNDLRFDPVVWRAHAGEDSLDNPRVKMLSDLRRHHLRPGMVRAEVEALLGPPDSERGGDWSYTVGYGPLFDIDVETLELGFCSGVLLDIAVIEH